MFQDVTRCSFMADIIDVIQPYKTQNIFQKYEFKQSKDNPNVKDDPTEATNTEVNMVARSLL